MSQPGLSLNSSKQALRFLTTGALNTLVGFAVIWALLVAGIGDITANISGYAVGLVLSFFVNRSWTFEQSQRPTLREVTLFGFTFLAAYSANLAVIMAGKSMGLGGNPLLHLAGVAVYTAASFMFAKGMIYAPASQQKFSLQLTPATAIFLGTIAALLIIPGLPITHDVIWQLWIARQMNNGVELYAQINEVNPPLWFWMAMPLDRVSTWLGTEAVSAVQVAIIALTSAACLLANRLLPVMPKWQRLFFLSNAFAVGLLLGLGNFAQREQIAMIAALPYALLLMNRALGNSVDWRIAASVALLATPAFALKPFFVAVPVLLELWLLFVRRREYRPFRLETLTLTAGAMFYAAAIWLFAPAFFSHQVPMDAVAYRGYEMPWLALLFNPQQPIWIGCIIVLLACGGFRRDNLTPFASVLGITAIGFLISYAAQKKGWPYHSMPWSYFLLLTVSVVAIKAFEKQRNFAQAALALLALSTGYIVPVKEGLYKSPFADATNEALAGTAKGSAVYILSSDAQKSWPMIVENGYIYPSRFMSWWMVPAIVAELGDKADLARVSDQIRSMTVTDLQCTPTATILVDRAVLNKVLRPYNFDFLAYFTENPEAKKLMSNYELVRKTSRFDVYHLKSDAKIASPANCRKIY